MINKFKILIIFFVLGFSFLTQGQVILNQFSSGSLIEQEKINENYIKINNYLQANFNETISFEDLSSLNINSIEFNQSVNIVNNKFSSNLPLFETKEPLFAQDLTNYFLAIANLINEKIAFNSCASIIQQTTGIKKIDVDGILGPINPSIQYCNYIYGTSSINKFRLRLYSADFERGSGNYVLLNETYINQNTGRGWTITILDENLDKVYQRRYDTYGSINESNAMISFLNTTTIRQGLVVFTTADEPQRNGSSYSTLRNAIQNYSGCSATTIATVPERGAYICAAMINSLGQKNVLVNQMGSNTASIDLYLDFLNYYNHVEL